MEPLTDDDLILMYRQGDADASGMKTMLADGLEKAARGVTSVREVIRVVPPGAHA